MAVTLRIFFNRHDAVYFAGELVTGRVVLNSYATKKVAGVSIRLKGEANVSWTESNSDDDSDTTYRASETYFDNKVYFIGGLTGCNGSADPLVVDILPGEHEYHFECLVPRVAPSSFEGQHGRVRYTATATIHRPWKFDHKATAAFTVISHLDLNSWPQAKEPVSVGETKHFCCGLCRSGPLSVDVHLASGGYVPGQVITGQVQVCNSSSVRVERVSFHFEKEVSWIATNKTKKTRTPLASNAFDSVVVTNNRKTFAVVIPVPAVPPSFLQNCSIIDLNYFVRVTAEVSGCRLNLHCDAPVVVGTIPVFVKDGWNKAQQQAAPSAPPVLLKAKLPPPTYEESCLKGNRIIDVTDSYTMGQADFTPRYPVWTFNNASSLEK